ncbi:hypothetical protein PP707_01785 [Acetobacter pasteurianus]|nr:hypothetical protein [Acetobacter pasteurianus]
MCNLASAYTRGRLFFFPSVSSIVSLIGLVVVVVVVVVAVVVAVAVAASSPSYSTQIQMLRFPSFTFSLPLT